MSRARAIADVSGGTILASVEIAAPPERVFTALTSGADVVKWWGSDDMYRTTEWTMPLTPGAAWKSTGVGADGVPFSVEGEVVKVDAPHELVWTWRPAWDGGNTTTITYRLEPIDGGTRLTLRHEGFGDRHDSCRSHGEGWERVFGWLSAHLPAPAPRYFFFRLVPPRATFPGDMSAAEGKAMGEHAAHLRVHAAEGTLIVAGPVGDPKGAWGMGVIALAEGQSPDAFAANDPVIRAGLGFRYEISPMMSAITR